MTAPTTPIESWAGKNARGEGWEGGQSGKGSVPYYGAALNAAGTPVPTSVLTTRKQSFGAVAAKVTNWWVTSIAGKAAAGSRALTLAHTTVATPRNIVVNVTHSTSIVACSFVAVGTDVHGFAVSETFTITATGTDKTATGKVAFAAVTSITETVAANASTNTIIVGTGDVLGLDRCLTAKSDMLAIHEDDAIVNTGTLVVAGTTAADDRRGTYTPTTTPNGTHTYDVTYNVQNPDILVAV